MIDEGCAVALASDLNPGSCFSNSIPLMVALGCIYMNMSIEEVITALTINGAAAVDRADTAVTLETLQDMISLMEKNNMSVLDIVQIAVTQIKKTGRYHIPEIPIHSLYAISHSN